MNLDTAIIKGDADKPSVIFIHGLGMDRLIWESPDKARIFGGRFPIGVLLSGEPEPETALAGGPEGGMKRFSTGIPPKVLSTLFHDLRERRYTVIAWSQSRPSAGVEVAVSELRALISMYDSDLKSGIILIGHSRGGLVARKYLQYGDDRVKGLITLATPHGGSAMAQWAKYTTPLISLVEPLLSDAERGTLTYAVKKVFDFLKSKAVIELLPDSRFFRSLADGRIKGTRYLSFGGNNPTLITVYRKAIENIGSGDRDRFLLRYKKVFSVPAIFETLIPEKIFPDEMKQGKGDGLVTVESSRLPWADEHHDFDVNHAGILFDKRLNSKVLDFINISE